MLYIHSIPANLQDSLYYMREVTMHTMDYIDAAMAGVLSPHVLPVEDLRGIEVSNIICIRSITLQ